MLEDELLRPEDERVVGGKLDSGLVMAAAAAAAVGDKCGWCEWLSDDVFVDGPCDGKPVTTGDPVAELVVSKLAAAAAAAAELGKEPSLMADEKSKGWKGKNGKGDPW